MKSDLMKDAPAVLRGPLSLISARPQKAAEALARLGLAADMQGVTGQFFKPSGPMRSSPYSHDAAIQTQLWQASQQLAPVDGPTG